MPYAFIPPGYRAVLVAQASEVKELGAFAPLEGSMTEGTLVLMKLDFLDPVSEKTLTELEQACRDAGVEPWPGNEYYVYATSNSVYITWQKGLAWLPIIIGIVAMTVLPVLLGSFLWWIMPESLKNLINMGMMILMLWVVSKIMPVPAQEKTKPKQIAERAS